MGYITQNYAHLLKMGDDATINSRELCDIINEYRDFVAKKKAEAAGEDVYKFTKLRHDHLLEKIGKYNDDMDAIDRPKIRAVKRKDKKGEMRKVYILDTEDAMMFAASESSIVQHFVAQYMRDLKGALSLANVKLQLYKHDMDQLKKVVDKIDKPEYYKRVNRFVLDTINKIHGTNFDSVGDISDPGIIEQHQSILDDYIAEISKTGRLAGVKKTIDNKYL